MENYKEQKEVYIEKIMKISASFVSKKIKNHSLLGEIFPSNVRKFSFLLGKVWKLLNERMIKDSVIVVPPIPRLEAFRRHWLLNHLHCDLSKSSVTDRRDMKDGTYFAQMADKSCHLAWTKWFDHPPKWFRQQPRVVVEPHFASVIRRPSFVQVSLKMMAQYDSALQSSLIGLAQYVWFAH